VRSNLFKKKKNQCVVAASGHVKACLIYSACYLCDVTWFKVLRYRE